MKDDVVNKISLLLPASDYEQAGKHHTTAKHWTTHSLPELLNKHFEKIRKGDDIVFLERIEISLGDYPWNFSSAEWEKKLAAAIHLNEDFNYTFQLVIKQWFFYLSNGCFEKTAIIKSIREMETYLLLHTASFSSELVHQYGGDLSLPAFQRLVHKHQKELVLVVIKNLLGISGEQAVQAYPQLKRRLQAKPTETYEILLELIMANQSGDLERKKRCIDGLSEQHFIAARAEDKLRGAQHAPGRYTKDVVAHKGEAYIECSHAGLVILFPYLERFFENCGLVAQHAFIDQAAQQTAIHALHFLATGESFAEEEQLVLPKLLCGVDCAAYVAFENALPAFIMDEGNELLQSVVDNWKILQHTSIQGLRETFLQRNGKLTEKNNAYTLQVEESGVDVLLNSIPWSFRHFKLPWMNVTLFTEWY